MATKTLEKDMLKWLTDCLDRTGWRWWHVPAPIVYGKAREVRPYKKAAGLPDVFALHEDPPRMLVIEVKGTGGKLSDEQREFLRLARNVAERTWQEPFKEWLDPDQPPHYFVCGKAVGVYVLEPGLEGAFEQMLRSKVLT